MDEPRDREMVTRIVRLQEDDRSFDQEFWQRQGVEAIFAAAWEMVRDYERLHGRTGDLRMDRSVGRITRLREQSPDR